MDILKAIWAIQAKGCKKKPYFCVSTKKGDSWKDHYFKWPNLGDLDEILRKHPSRDYNLYFCPLPFEQPHRRKEYVIGSGLLWADIDESKPDKMEHPPHILWESSPGRWAGLWTVERWLEVGELEKFNRRMTYGTGSDPAGWDLTQVLRIPGTRNHKYDGSPEGKLVRVDLKGRLKLGDVPEEVSRTGEGKAVEVYKKWEKKLSARARSILGAEKAEEGKRSAVLWKLYNLLLDAGVPIEEIKQLVKWSVWNKYEGRRDEDKQLERDIKKCLAERPEVGETRGKAALAGINKDFYKGITLDKVQREEVDWIWWPYLSRGALTILEGDPGQGKSYMMQIICAAICDGGRLPGEGGLDGWEKIKQGRVYYLGIEDGIGTVIKPRLEDNGLRNMQNFMVCDQAFTMDEDGLARVEMVVEEFKPEIVVFDTINYYIGGGTDIHRSNEVSAQLEHFARLAKEYNIAVVILRHLTKDSSGAKKGIYRGSGSIAFTGTAREVLTVSMHPDEEGMKLMTVTKLNLEKPPLAVGFSITSEKRGTSRFEWSDKLYDLKTDDVIDVRATSKKDGGGGELEEAKKFLRETLSGGEADSSVMSRMAEARGISTRTLTRARKELGVKVERRKDKWWSSLG